MSDASIGAAPQLSVTSAGVSIGPECGVVRVGWELANLTGEPIEILEGWLPHGRFFGERQAFEPALKLSADESEIIHRSVRYIAEPGEVVANAFLNLRVRYVGQPWRVLIRMRVECAAGGAVDLTVEAVTTHHVGFAQAVTEEGDR